MNSEILYKQLTAFVILAMVLIQTFSKSLIVADYYTHTSAYAANCENKANPQMHCNGKCQMMKKLNQEENKDKQNPNRRTDNNDEVLSSKSFFPSIINRPAILKIDYPFTKTAVAVDRSFAVFHPPQITYTYKS